MFVTSDANVPTILKPLQRGENRSEPTPSHAMQIILPPAWARLSCMAVHRSSQNKLFNDYRLMMSTSEKSGGFFPYTTRTLLSRAVPSLLIQMCSL